MTYPFLFTRRVTNSSNNFAISSDGVGQALQRSAAAMAAAHATIDETVALATAANTTVQNPEIVGTALRSLSMYLRASKTEALEAGEDIEGMANSVSELRDEILALTNNKVDLQIDEDSFKGPYQIMKELSEVWDDLTDTSRANILELIAGKRNSNTTMAIIENFKIAEKSLETSMNSAGSALAENEKYLDSIQGKVQKFQAAWQALSTSIVSTDLTKMIVDLARWFVEGITWMTDTLGGLSLAIGAVPLTVFISKLKPVAEVIDTIKLAWKDFAGGEKRLPY